MPLDSPRDRAALDMTKVGISTLNGGGNPYLSLLYDALDEQGVSLVEAELHPWRLVRVDQGYEALHVHWPEYTMAGPGAGAVHAARVSAAAMALRTSVQLLRSRGVRIVWTAHNARPHNPSSPPLQRGLYPWFAANSDAVIVHTKHAARAVREQLGRTGPMYLARHGNYLGMYDTPIVPRDELRQRNGFNPSDVVLLAFGQIAAYKRLVELVEDFTSLGPDNAHLVIAGSSKDDAVTARLHALCSSNDRITLIDRFVPDEEVGALYSMADLAVFNYSEIFSSGALMLAFSLGLAVLAPAEGSDEISNDLALYRWRTSPFESLPLALAVDADHRRAAALAVAGEHTWADAAQVHLAAYTGAESNV